MSTYLAVHEHNEGHDYYLAECDHEPTADELVEHLGINYEPDLDGESIDITQLEAVTIPPLPPTPPPNPEFNHFL